MFEKSLYDLIRGLRNHKGNERAYIQGNIRECRREIRGQDMDVKATALLKLTYLEMFGHDMSWASFNVLEVMSSQKYPQKRVGYLAAVQSFRPDTEVLMLAENQLKKDIGSPIPTTIALPLVAIPHVLNVSMANSLLSDLLPRLAHSNAIIRKKTIVTLYRLALIYPETLRPAWPKIKERLQDEAEDPSVTAAVVNVVCELGWRRPQDFLPLAPRLFDLLVESNNNWMAIKIVKLFAILTPLEPRLVKKLLPPLTTIIKTTPAMSLLYECINGIISGGILTSSTGSTEGDEVARLCVGKLRGMLAVGGDPNLKYVALLALERIVELHPHLVSLHEDAILECIDDPDMSIRLRALDLAAGMVDSHNLTAIVDRLLRQLLTSPQAATIENIDNDRATHDGIEPYADSDDENAGQSLQPSRAKARDTPSLPDDYRSNAILTILKICSQDNYANINSFEWYINILLSLVQHAPMIPTTYDCVDESGSVAGSVGVELRNVAVRVRSSRSEATRAAETLLSIHPRPTSVLLGNPGTSGSQSVLGPAAWIAGECATHLVDAQACLESLTHADRMILPPSILNVFIQAAVKVFAFIAGDQERLWSPEWKTMVTLLMSRMIRFLELLSTHPNLETQETAVEYLELLRLAAEATSGDTSSNDAAQSDHAPLLLTQAIPSLFAGVELNPVASDAQQKVPLPDEVNLERAVNDHLDVLLQAADSTQRGVSDDADFYDYYYRQPKPRETFLEPAANRLDAADEPISYQHGSIDTVDADLLSQKRAQRQAHLQDDPFYISSQRKSGNVTPVHDILRASNGEEVDVDSIPIMELDLGDDKSARLQSEPDTVAHDGPATLRKNVDILIDENIDRPRKAGPVTGLSQAPIGHAAAGSARRGFLEVDSSGLGSLSLNEKRETGKSRTVRLDVERQEAEEAEMAEAMKEVERLRLEMQRAQERIQARSETTVVKKRPKKKRMAGVVQGAGEGMAAAPSMDHSSPDDPPEAGNPTGVPTANQTIAKKKKKRKKPRDPQSGMTANSASDIVAVEDSEQVHRGK